MSNKLKLCPLCGGEADFQISYYHTYARISCNKCGLSTLDLKGDDDGKKRLIELWNNRVNDPKWIPIEQQKPPEHDWYFVFFPANKEQGTIDYVDVCFWDGTSFVDSGIGYKEDGIGYTHWMPFPEPPKGE